MKLKIILVLLILSFQFVLNMQSSKDGKDAPRYIYLLKNGKGTTYGLHHEDDTVISEVVCSNCMTSAFYMYTDPGDPRIKGLSCKRCGHSF